MEGNWALSKESIEKKCNEYITILNTDIQDLKNTKSELKKISDESKLEGKALDKFKLMLSDYDSVINLAILADEKDIEDCNALKEKADESYSGNFISHMYNCAEEDRDEYRRIANDYREKANNFCSVIKTILTDGTEIITTVANPYWFPAFLNDLYADKCQEEMNLWQLEKDEFDSINESTSNLFKTGNALRELSKALLALMDKNAIENNYETSISGALYRDYNTLKIIRDIEKRSFFDNKEEFKTKHPEHSEMVDLQTEIYLLQDKIEKCENETAKEQMKKQLDRLKDKQRHLFCQGFYKYDAEGNIVGNNLQDWKNDNENDTIDFFLNVFRSNNKEYLDISDSNTALNNSEKLETVSAIEKLKKLKESIKGNSIAQEEIQKQINYLENKLEKDGTGTVIWSYYESHDIEKNGYDKEDILEYAYSSILLERATVCGKFGCSKESVRSMVETFWNNGIVPNGVESYGANGNLSVGFLAFAISGSLTADEDADVSAGLNVGAGLTEGTTPFSASFTINQTDYLAEDVDDIGKDSISLGGSGGMIVLFGKLPVPLYGGVDLIMTSDSFTKKGSKVRFGKSKSIGLGVPGAEVHGIYSKTVLDKEFNVYSVFDEIVENMEGK